MGDLIDRQKAIDAIRASTSKYTGFMEMEMYTDDDAVEAIKALPSAHPEDYEWCTGCKEYDHERGCCPRFGKVIAETVAEVKQNLQIIRCKECKHRDPEDKKCDCGHDIVWQLPRDDNWFCADGERGTDDA